MSDTDLDPPEGGVIEESMADALSRRYLAYALSTITSRALPDVRDGLKPVQRRILYAMRELKLSPSAAFRKSAKVVGDVMGNLHPHGDQAIYDTMVRLAQDFSVRAPLIDGQGNFGNVDGDGAAAMRYTESRMTLAAELLLEGLDEDAVDFRDTYDERDKEPVVLPAGFPNVLVNGATGIAVGMATSIPPHNPVEAINAALAMIERPGVTLDSLLKIMPGPDFPTGGVIVESAEAMRNAYETGRGGFRVQARWQKEDMGRGQWRIVITEIPYQVQKAKLIERLAELIETKKAPLLGDVRDESAEDLRIILEPRARTAEPEMLMASLFKLSDLETRISINMNVLDRGAPKVMGLTGVLRAFLDHRREVVVRRALFRLGKIEARLEVLGGYLIAYLNIDEVIRIIREEDEPKAVMMARFGLTEVQTEAILNMRLRALRKLEEFEIRKEHDALSAERAQVQALIAGEDLQWARVGEQLKAARDAFKSDPQLGKRRSTFGEALDIDTDAVLEALIPKEPITAVLSKKGWIRAVKGHGVDADTLKFKEGDELALTCTLYTTDKLLLAASDGRVFTLGGDRLPGGRGHGEPLRLSIELGDGEDILTMFVAREGARRIVAASTGHGFVVPECELVSQKRGGRQVLNVSDGARLAVIVPFKGDHVAVVGENRKLLIFAADELPEMGRGKGVKLQNYKDGGLLDVIGFDAAEGFGWTDAGNRLRALPEWREWLGKRAGAGRMVPRGFPRTGRFTPE
jgi:topoisomerase-4 subunit A